MPASTGAMGSGIPIRPVWHTRISDGSTPNPSATSAHMRSAPATPAAPVAALALPLESTTAAARPPVRARWARLTCTGAAAARFAVNTPAAGTGPDVAATSARSGAPDALIPHATPAATNPAGAVMLTGTPRQ